MKATQGNVKMVMLNEVCNINERVSGKKGRLGGLRGKINLWVTEVKTEFKKATTRKSIPQSDISWRKKLSGIFILDMEHRGNEDDLTPCKWQGES